MAIQYRKLLCVALLVLALAGGAYAQTPVDAVTDAVANSGMFPEGTSVVSVTTVGGSITVDLSAEAIPAGFGDTQADGYTDAILAALSGFPGIDFINITVAGVPVEAYLPVSTLPDFAPLAGSDSGAVAGAASVMAGALSAQSPLVPPSVASLSSELSGKLIVLGPSHGTYASNTGWFRAMRTLCGPNPVTNRPPGIGNYQPSDYYYWTRGFRWPMYYEDDMSPELIRFVYAYCKAAGAATYVNRNLDKTAGVFPHAQYGYPAPNFTMYKWMTACKYALEDRGGIPASVWNTSDVSAQSDKDLRARAYYVNWLMQTLGYNYTNTVYLALHSNAANTGNPPQAQARGTETLYSLANTQWKTEQANDVPYCNAMLSSVINSIRNQYDGFWANDQYSNVLYPTPREWNTSYGTYRGYDHAGASTGAGSNGWQNRGVKAGNYGEIRECKCPAQLMELVFHDDWKFYPDQAFHQDQIFRSTVAWGMYEGFCDYFGVPKRARLNASVDSVSFPTIVGPNQAINGTVSVKNLGQAWCWGMKMIGTNWSPYTVWNLQATADDQFAAGTKIAIADDGVYYPGDTAAFSVSLTAPATTGLYTTAWQMVKDDAKGGAFGAVATAQIQVDADGPAITITSPAAQDYAYGQVAVDFSAVDALSAVTSITADIDGVPVTDGQIVGGLALGAHVLTVTAVDTFGNTSTQSVTFNVVNSVGKVSVGGWIELIDKKATCGFSCEYVDGAAAPAGNLTYQDHDTGMTVKSVDMVAMGIAGNQAWFYGTCTIEGEAGHWFRVDVTDNGEPGDTDVFNIMLDTGYSKGGTLGGGNVQVF